MQKKIALWALWLGFIIYAFFLAPPESPETWTVIQNLSTGKFQGINPLVISVFNLLGVIPLLYSCLIYIDGRVQKVPAWPFSVGSFVVGAFALIPYLALREPNDTFVGQKNAWLKIMDSRWTGGIVAIATLTLLFYGLMNGDWNDFVQQWQTSRFVNVTSLDFCLVCLLFPVLLGDDMTRRGLKDRRIFWAVALVPLLGAIAYVTLRPPLIVPEN
ncbi:MAG: DUF2834 domain-containing protein [Timaviella obliquedivisa GSE-PSE-MK23-08B]|jgi:hypothetical protein|nr:DUF2834 domain-containing protein [Timaviella obliquedivisa GSE-PSE-MK23-08B]